VHSANARGVRAVQESNVQINIDTFHPVTDDNRPMLVAVLTRIAQYENLSDATIYVNNRNKDGWLEFLYRMQFKDGGKLTVGCIQRKPDEQFEFHS
jgi:hypothetical protein